MNSILEQEHMSFTYHGAISSVHTLTMQESLKLISYTYCYITLLYRVTLINVPL